MAGKKIVIDDERCNGCGICVEACHEGALGMVNGKATVVNNDCCDGFGDCLPMCPCDAISFVDVPSPSGKNTVPMGDIPIAGIHGIAKNSDFQWPIQLALVPVKSPFFKGSIVFSADCAAFAHGDFKKLISNRPVIIGCPKLDERSRFDKVAEILDQNEIDEAIVVRMEVPCCRALTAIVKNAAEAANHRITVREVVLARDGKVLGAEILS